MKTRVITLTANILLGALLLGAYAGELKTISPDTADFTLVKSAEGITLYERWYSIEANQNAREVKATFVIRADAASVLALLRDGERGALWNKNTNEYKVVEIGRDSWVCYMEYDLPWPVSNQDCVLEYNATWHSNSLIVDFEAVNHPDFPERNRIQRIPGTRGKWIFRKVAEGLEVEYYISTTPSKSLPNWLTDPIIRNNLIETVGAFRSMLENEALSHQSQQ